MPPKRWERWVGPDTNCLPRTWDEEKNGTVLWSKSHWWITVKNSDAQEERFVRLYSGGVVYASCGEFKDAAAPRMVDQIIERTVVSYMEACNQFDEMMAEEREANKKLVGAEK